MVTRRTVLEERKAALLTGVIRRAGLFKSEKFSQFDEPRYARTASIFGASYAAVPAFKALGSMRSACVVPIHEQPRSNSAA